MVIAHSRIDIRVMYNRISVLTKLFLPVTHSNILLLYYTKTPGNVPEVFGQSSSGLY